MANRGAPRGNTNAEQHGLRTLRNSIRKRSKRGRSFIDLRSNSGRNAVGIQAGLITDLGGAEHISTAQKVLIELVGRDLYLLDETDQRIVKACKEWPRLKNSPKGMAILYGYRVPIINSLTRTLMALGLDRRPPPAKTLEQILAEDDANDDDQNNSVEDP